MSNLFDIGIGSALACSVVVAQVSGVDLASTQTISMLDLILRAGSPGILGGILVYSLYNSRKTTEQLAATFKDTMETVESAHVESSKKFSDDVDRLVKADLARTAVLDRAIQHCASVNGVPR